MPDGPEINQAQAKSLFSKLRQTPGVKLGTFEQFQGTLKNDSKLREIHFFLSGQDPSLPGFDQFRQNLIIQPTVKTIAERKPAQPTTQAPATEAQPVEEPELAVEGFAGFAGQEGVDGVEVEGPPLDTLDKKDARNEAPEILGPTPETLEESLEIMQNLAVPDPEAGIPFLTPEQQAEEAEKKAPKKPIDRETAFQKMLSNQLAQTNRELAVAATTENPLEQQQQVYEQYLIDLDERKANISTIVNFLKENEQSLLRLESENGRKKLKELFVEKGFTEFDVELAFEEGDKLVTTIKIAAFDRAERQAIGAFIAFAGGEIPKGLDPEELEKLTDEQIIAQLPKFRIQAGLDILTDKENQIYGINQQIIELLRKADPTDADQLEVARLRRERQKLDSDFTELFDPITGTRIANPSDEQKQVAMQFQQEVILEGNELRQNFGNQLAEIYNRRYLRFKMLEEQFTPRLQQAAAAANLAGGLSGASAGQAFGVQTVINAERIQPLFIEAKRDFYAISRAFLLNEDFGGVKRTGIGSLALQAAVKSFIPQALFPKGFEIGSDQEWVDQAFKVFSDENIALTKEQIERYELTLIEEVALGVGAITGLLPWLIVGNKVTSGISEVTGLLKIVSTLSQSKSSLSKFGAFMIKATLEEVKTQTFAGLEPGVGAGFAFGGSIMKSANLGFKSGIGKIVQPYFEKALQGSIGVTLGQEIGSGLSAVARALSEDKGIIEELDKAGFGDLSETGRRIMMELMTNWVFGFGSTVVSTAAKSAKQAVTTPLDPKRLNQLVTELESIGKGIEAQEVRNKIDQIAKNKKSRIQDETRKQDEAIEQRKIAEEAIKEPVAKEVKPEEVEAKEVPKVEEAKAEEPAKEPVKKVPVEEKAPVTEVKEEKAPESAVTAPEFKKFRDIIKKSKTPEEAFEAIREIKDVPPEVTERFSEEFGKTATPKEAFGEFFKQVKAEKAPVKPVAEVKPEVKIEEVPIEEAQVPRTELVKQIREQTQEAAKKKVTGINKLIFQKDAEGKHVLSDVERQTATLELKEAIDIRLEKTPSQAALLKQSLKVINKELLKSDSEIIEAKKELDASLKESRTKLTAGGIDPNVLKALTKLGVAYVKRGFKTAKEFATAIGEKFNQNIQKAWDAAKKASGLFVPKTKDGKKIKTREAEFNEPRAADVERVLQDQRKAVQEKFNKTTIGFFKGLRQKWIRGLEDVSGNVKESLYKLGAAKAIMKKDLIAGSGARARQQFIDAQKEIYGKSEKRGKLSKSEEEIFNDFMQMRRTVEIDTIKDKRGEARPKHPGGKGKEEAQKWLDEFKKNNPELFTELERRSKAHFKAINKMIDEKLEAQIITKTLHGLLKEQANFVPRLFMQHMTEPAETQGVSGGKVTVSRSDIKKLSEGSEQNLFNDTRQLLSNALLTHNALIMKNKANLALLNFARLNPDNFVVTEVKPIGKTGKGDPKFPDTPEGFEAINVLEKGVVKKMIMPEELAKEWITKDPDIKQDVANIIRMASGSSVLRFFATGTNPAFALSNLPRDIAHVLMVTEVYSPFLPVALVQINRDIIKVSKDAIKRKGRWREYIDEGGGMEFMTQQGRLLKTDPIPVEKWKQGLEATQHFLGYINETSEIMVRLAVREGSIRKQLKAFKGEPTAAELREIKETATWEARNQMDFAQGGSWAKGMDHAVPYLNAGIQGSRVMLRTARRNPKLFAIKLTQLGALATGLYLYNSRQDGFDEISDIVKSLNFIIMLPYKTKDDEGNTIHHYITIPKSFEQRAFAGMFENTAEWIHTGKLPTKKSVQDLSSIHPFMQIIAGEIPILQQIPVVNAVFTYKSNWDNFRDDFVWKGKDVESWAEFTTRTPKFYKDIGKALDWSPTRLQRASGKVLTNMQTNFWGVAFGKSWDLMMETLDVKERDELDKSMIKQMKEFGKPIYRRYLKETRPKAPVELLERFNIEENTKRKIANDAVKKFVKDIDAGKKTLDDFREFLRAQPKPDRERLFKLFRKTRERKGVEFFWIQVSFAASPEVKARIFFDRWQKASEEERKEMLIQIKKAGGIISKRFIIELGVLKKQIPKD